MADVITRLKVESSEYENKIRRASEGLLQMEQACRKVDGTLAILDQDEKDFVISLGKMDTVSRDARGRINELTKAFQDLSAQYNRLTDEEKKGDYGKALSASLGELKDRIKDARIEMGQINSQMGQGGLGGVLDAVASKLGISRAAFTKAGAAIAGITAAVKVARDAFLTSEKNIDDWSRTVSSAKAVYEGFLTAINTGDISGYLSRIGQISQASRQAYTEMDALGTLRMVNSVPYQRQLSENERNRAMLRTRRNLDTGAFLSDAEVKQIEANMEAGIKNLGTLVQAEIKQADSAISALYDKQSTILVMSREEFLAGTSSYAELQKRITGAAQYRQWEKDNRVTYEYTGGRTGRQKISQEANPYQEYSAWSVFKDDGELFQTIVQTIQQREALLQRYYQLLQQGYQTINRVEGITSRTDPVTGREGLTALAMPGIAVSNTFDSAARLKAAGQEISSLQMPVRSLPDDEGPSLKETMKSLSQATSGLSSIMSGLQQVGIEIPDEAKQVVSTIQGLMSIIQGVISVIQAFSTVSQTANTTALVSLTAAVSANTAALGVNTATNFIPLAHGGVVKAATGVVVPGTSWSGDRVPALLNSGELVLNRAQQGNLVAQLNSINRQPVTGQPYVSGELIFLAMSNYLKRSGRGEILLAK